MYTPLLALVADAGPGPVFIPVAGSFAIGGVFFVLAIVSGGLWYVRRTQVQEAFRWRKRAIVLAGASVCLMSFLAGLAAESQTGGVGAIGVVVLMLIIGIVLIRFGIKSSRGASPGQDSDVRG